MSYFDFEGPLCIESKECFELSIPSLIIFSGCVVLKDNGKVELRAPQDSFQFKSSIRGLADQTHEFSFSRVFDEKTQQKELFDEIMLPFAKDILDGQNGLVFTYGVTNSGKVCI